MRQTTDIICDLDNVKARIAELNMQKNDLIKELIEATAAKFEKETNVKRGDPIKTERHREPSATCELMNLCLTFETEQP